MSKESKKLAVEGKKNKIVTLLTDFGDYYPGVMKGVILKSVPDVKIVDITHSVEPQNVNQGAFLLLNSYHFFPPSVHVAVVDPEVGGRRNAIIVECKEHVFIGPDNGILYPACKDAGIKRIWRIREEKIGMQISRTFHGRDVFAPAVIYVLKGSIGRIAEKERSMKELDLFDYKIGEKAIECKVLFIDRFGNAITNLKREVVEEITPKGFYLGKQRFPLVEKYSDVSKGSSLSIIGSFDTLELSVREGDASKTFNIKSGLIKLGLDG
jgi:hypothetical protein